MLYTAAIDDSADRHRERVVVSAAVIGDTQRWSMLSRRWRDRLRDDGLEYFKSSHCRHLRGQFFKFRDQQKYPPTLGRERADRVQADLDEIIHESRLMTLGAIVPMAVYNKMQDDPEYLATPGRDSDPYHWAVQAVWGECALAMMELGRNNIVTFAHDNGSNFHILQKLFMDYKERNRKHAKVMTEFVAVDDKVYPSVQAADVAASVTFRYAEDWAVNPTPNNLKRLRQNMYKIVIWNEKAARYAIRV